MGRVSASRGRTRRHQAMPGTESRDAGIRDQDGRWSLKHRSRYTATINRTSREEEGGNSRIPASDARESASPDLTLGAMKCGKSRGPGLSTRRLSQLWGGFESDVRVRKRMGARFDSRESRPLSREENERRDSSIWTRSGCTWNLAQQVEGGGVTWNIMDKLATAGGRECASGHRFRSNPNCGRLADTEVESKPGDAVGGASFMCLLECVVRPASSEE